MKLRLAILYAISTILVAGQMAVFSSLEKDDLQIEEYPSWQGTKRKIIEWLELK